MTQGVRRLPPVALGAAALVWLIPLSSLSAATANAEVHKHASAAPAVHRAAMQTTHAFHGATSTSSTRRFVSTSTRTYASSRRYGSGYRYGGSTVTGGVVGGGYTSGGGGYYGGGEGYSSGGVYGGGYGYHHSCRWYYNNEPNNVPSWCGTYSGPSYGYGGPSYSYGYAYGSSGSTRVSGYSQGGGYRHTATSSSWRRSTHTAHAGVRAAGGTHMAAGGTHMAHGPARPAATGGHTHGHPVP
jgi:hypothetical protein